jgi:alkylation response protein AidB-like acyl-CoA dehydrogenase
VRFDFTADQRLFQESVRNLLEKECPAEGLRALAPTETGRSSERWRRLAEVGLLALLAPESHGGLGLDEVDLVLPLEETGRVALPEPVVETAAVAVPLLRDANARVLRDEWLPRVSAGEAILTVGHDANPCVSDAHVASLLLLQKGDEIHALPRERVALERQPCNDPCRRLFRVRWTAGPDTRIVRGEEGRRLLDAAFDRGALAAAAQLLGIGQQLVDLAARYATERHQFGRPIGAFQAVKHMLANAQVRLEFARPAVYRAAFSVARAAETRAVDVSHAKAAAGEAAVQAARAALQVHGAIGYTWEADLHFWMKRAWALEAVWGGRVWHRARAAAAVLDGTGCAASFGYTPRDPGAGLGT